LASKACVFNTSRNYYLKRNQAAKAVENCAAAWIEYGVTIRDLNLAEAIEARNHRAAIRTPLPLAEIHGIIYRPATGTEAAARTERQRAREANVFAELARPAL